LQPEVRANLQPFLVVNYVFPSKTTLLLNFTFTIFNVYYKIRLPFDFIWPQKLINLNKSTEKQTWGPTEKRSNPLQRTTAWRLNTCFWTQLTWKEMTSSLLPEYIQTQCLKTQWSVPATIIHSGISLVLSIFRYHGGCL
jgi:hypothetical protein